MLACAPDTSATIEYHRQNVTQRHRHHSSSIDHTLRGVSSQESRLGEKSVSSLVTSQTRGYSMECIGSSRTLQSSRLRARAAQRISSSRTFHAHRQPIAYLSKYSPADQAQAAVGMAHFGTAECRESPRLSLLA